MRGRHAWPDMVLLAGLAVLTRGLFALVYEPQLFPDSTTYVTLARHLVAGTLLHYGGERTPGYPLLLIAAGMSEHATWLLQAALGVGLSMTSYLAVRAGGGGRVAACCAGVAPALLLNQLAFEAAIMSEALAGFLVAVSIPAFLAVAQRPTVRFAVLLGAIAALATLTRPGYLVLAPVYFVLLALPVPRRALAPCLAAFTVAALVPLVAWASVVKAATGQFALTTLAGYSLSNHAGGFMELAPDRYATIRDIYLRHRPERQQESPSRSHANTAIGARAELLAATGLTPVQLSNELAALSMELFRRHPARYARSVAEAWIGFWAVPIYWYPERIHPAAARTVLAAVWQVEHALMRAGNLAFVLVAAWLALVITATAIRQRRRLDVAELAPMAVAAVVLASSLAQALVEFGDNPRFGVPTQPLVVCLLCMAASRLAHRRALTAMPRAAPPRVPAAPPSRRSASAGGV